MKPIPLVNEFNGDSGGNMNANPIEVDHNGAIDNRRIGRVSTLQEL